MLQLPLKKKSLFTSFKRRHEDYFQKKNVKSYFQCDDKGRIEAPNGCEGNFVCWNLMLRKLLTLLFVISMSESLNFNFSLSLFKALNIYGLFKNPQRKTNFLNLRKRSVINWSIFMFTFIANHRRRMHLSNLLLNQFYFDQCSRFERFNCSINSI